MDGAFATPAFIVTTFVFLVFAIYLRQNWLWRTSKKLPPGSMGLPFVGEGLWIIKACSATTLGGFMEKRMARYGKIFSSNLLGTPMVVSADAELSRFILKNEPRLFGPSLPRQGLLGPWNIARATGDAHKHLKSAVLEFLNGERVRTLFLADADRSASLVVDSWTEGATVSANEEATKFSFYVLAKKVASIAPEDSRIGRLREGYVGFFKGLMSIPLYVPGTTYWKAFKARKTILKIFNEEMKERVARGRIGEADDLLGCLMNNPNYSEPQIDDLLLAVLLAGFDTTARAVSFLIYCLEGCPEATKQLRDEHIRVASAKNRRGENRLTWDDYKSMEFTKCVINEALRLANIVPFSLKSVTKDVPFKDYVIPQGWNVLVSYTAVHFDRSQYDDPEKFDPWRWQCSGGTKITNNYMPFGGGVRMCPGSELAMLEMAMFLHHLVLKYDWELVEPDHPVRKPFLEFRKGLRIRVRATATEPAMSSSSS